MPYTGTGEPYTKQQPRIADRCPGCGAQSLFIGAGGWITCGVIGCKSPSIEATLDRGRAEGFNAGLEEAASVVKQNMEPWNTGHRALAAIRALKREPTP